MAAVKESMDLVASRPSSFSLERTQSDSSLPRSDYSSDGGDEPEEDELPTDFQDVVPVKSKKEAVALNNDVTERVKASGFWRIVHLLSW